MLKLLLLTAGHKICDVSGPRINGMISGQALDVSNFLGFWKSKSLQLWCQMFGKTPRPVLQRVDLSAELL